MRLPHFNRLTGIRWWRQIRPPDRSKKSRLLSFAKIAGLLRSPSPCAMGKIGTTELMGLEYLYRWIQLPWPPSASWRRPARRLYECSGLYPVQRDVYLRWAKEYQKALKEMDVLAPWQTPSTYLSVLEERVLHLLAPQAFLCHRGFANPLHPAAPWLEELVKLRWLVVHPFIKTVQAQMPRLNQLGIYPSSSAFELKRRGHDTQILACPQFAYMINPAHSDWFAVFEDLKKGMEAAIFDVALIGAGAWSLPLAAHAKHLGRKAIHLGGSLQLLFGIKGRRFDHTGIYNENWIRPVPEECPPNFHRMENGAYW